MAEAWKRFEELLSSEWGPYIVTYGLGGIKVIAILFFTWVVAGMAARVTLKSFRKARLEDTLAKFFSKAVRWTILLLGLLLCLSIFGFETTSFAAVIASAGLAIGLAFQGTLSNFAAGIMLLIFRPFKVGQTISVSSVTGKVDEIDLFTTTLDTPDNRRLIMPNSAIFGHTIENIGHHLTRRVDLAVGCSYEADLDETRKILANAASRVEGILLEPEPAIVLTELGASSVNWSVRVWCNRDEFFSIRESLIRAVKIALDDAGIGIPYPQMDVHISQATFKNVA